MKLQDRLSPMYTPSAFALGEIQVLRERILQSILLFFSAIGLIQLILIAVIIFHSEGQALLGAYIFFYLIILAFTFARELPYNLRGFTAITLMFLLAVVELLESGQLGEVRMLLIVFVAMTAVLFNWKISTAAIAVGAASVTGIRILGSSDAAIQVMPVFANLSQAADWLTSTVSFLMYSAVVAGAITLIIDGLQNNLRKQASLTSALESERSTLENRVQERTEDLSRRLLQLRTAFDITRSMSSLTNPDDMLRRNVELIRERFDLYYVGVFLLDHSGHNAVLRAGTGEAGRKMLADAHRLSVGGISMIGWAISNRKARIALDVGSDAVRFSNPNLPLTRSELALPVNAGDNILGAMTVQSKLPDAFDENDIVVLQGIADAMGITLENDHLYNETRQSLDEIRVLNREYLQRAWAETIETYGELSYSYENTGVSNPTTHTQVIEVPLMLRDEVIGQIVLETDRTILSDDENNFIDNITNQTAIALENARLLEETERRAIQEQKLNELTVRFSSALSIDEILRAAAQDLGQLPSVAGVAVHLSPPAIPTQSAAPTSPVSGDNGKEPAA
jgi:GAF domain-containing protein